MMIWDKSTSLLNNELSRRDMVQENVDILHLITDRSKMQNHDPKINLDSEWSTAKIEF